MSNKMDFLLIPEIEQKIYQLERGTLVTKFFLRKKPERKTLMIRRETRQIIWARNCKTKLFDGSGEIFLFFFSIPILINIFVS